MARKVQVYTADLEELPLESWTGTAGGNRCSCWTILEGRVVPLDQAVKQGSREDRVGELLQTHPGVDAITALA